MGLTFWPPPRQPGLSRRSSHLIHDIFIDSATTARVNSRGFDRWSPAAYKPTDAVVAAQAGLVEIVTILQLVY